MSPAVINKAENAKNKQTKKLNAHYVTWIQQYPSISNEHIVSMRICFLTLKADVHLLAVYHMTQSLWAGGVCQDSSGATDKTVTAAGNSVLYLCVSELHEHHFYIFVNS